MTNLVTESAKSRLNMSDSQFDLVYRPRRLRSSQALRAMVRETKIDLKKLIHPLFLIEGNGKDKKNPIKSMPGFCQQTIDSAFYELETIQNLGLGSVILFGIPDLKDSEASQSFEEDGIIQNAIRAFKKEFPNLVVIADTCLCEYMSHGHCGIVCDGQIENDASLTILAKAALAQAQAGADIIAPSDMMDGRVAAIRQTLDENGFRNTPIMAYSAKFASAFYGPFREAAQSAPQFGDRKSYQMDPANGREALREVELDIMEGADIVMVKPALPYLDVIHATRQLTNLPVAAYNVSGEYSMVKAAAQNGWIDEQKVVEEVLTSITRAGADLIITYHARDFANWTKTQA